MRNYKVKEAPNLEYKYGGFDDQLRDMAQQRRALSNLKNLRGATTMDYQQPQKPKAVYETLQQRTNEMSRLLDKLKQR